tara:strand:+ start:1182 stop:2345 length:1164 start_codon:yes stop_codon:yes gene_type:complete
MLNRYNQSNIKLIIFSLAIICIITIFILNKSIINHLRNDARKQVEYLTNSYTKAINSDNAEDISFVMDILLPSINFPIIITSNNEVSSIMNLNIHSMPGTVEYDNEVWKIINRMDKTFKPLNLEWNGIKWGRVHYLAPEVVEHLSWMPYLEISFGIIFIIISLFGMQHIRNSEKNMIYTGMAKEVAHQLGTPISSLIGWSKLIRDKKGNVSSIISSMDDDIIRLSDISERFSKIGSIPKFKLIELYDLILESVEYMNNRLPKKKHINLNIIGKKNIKTIGDWILLRWAIENVLKNAIDAIGTGSGYISIDLQSEKNYTYIFITDTGKGIPRKDWKNIFQPGFSSKLRGWGLGLSLTKRIIQDIHKGEIRVINSKPNKTTFKFTLPNI